MFSELEVFIKNGRFCRNIIFLFVLCKLIRLLSSYHSDVTTHYICHRQFALKKFLKSFKPVYVYNKTFHVASTQWRRNIVTNFWCTVSTSPTGISTCRIFFSFFFFLTTKCDISAAYSHRTLSVNMKLMWKPVIFSPPLHIFISYYKLKLKRGFFYSYLSFYIPFLVMQGEYWRSYFMLETVWRFVIK